MPEILARLGYVCRLPDVGVKLSMLACRIPRGVIEEAAPGE